MATVKTSKAWPPASYTAMIATQSGKGLKESLAPILKRLDALEAQRAEFKYVGSWQSGKQFKAGNFATHAGGVWHANEDTDEKPGQSNSWTLAVKSGR